MEDDSQIRESAHAACAIQAPAHRPMPGRFRRAAVAAGQGVRQSAQQTFHSLSNRNYRLFFIGQTISNTGNWLTNVALVLLVLNLTHSGLAVGLLTACQYGPVLFLSPWAGAIADHTDKRRMLMVTQSLEMAQSFGLAILAFMPHPPIPGLYALALIGGALLAFDNPFRRSFVTEMVPPAHIANAVVLNSTIVNVSRIFGPALAGLLVVTVGYGWCFALDSLSYVAVLIALALMRPAELYRHAPKPRGKGEVRAGFRYIGTLPQLWISFAMLAAIGTLAYNFNVTLPLFVTDALHSSEAVYTVLYSVFSFGAVVCALVVANKGLVRIRHIIVGAGAMGIAMLALALTPGVPAALVAVFFVGVASILYMTATTALVQIEARPDMHGRVLSLQTVLIGGTNLIGGPICGALADAAGGRAPLVLGGVVCLVAAGFGLAATRRFVPGGWLGGEGEV